MMNLNRLSIHTLANVTGIVVPTLVTLAAVPLYLKLIGIAQYGVLLLVVSLLAYFGAFDFGIGQAVNRSLACNNDCTENSITLWTGLAIGLLMGLFGSAILYFVASMLLEHVFLLTPKTRSDALYAIPLLVSIVPIMSLTAILNGALQGKSLFIQSNIAQMVGFSGIQLFPLLAATLGFTSLSGLILFSIFGRLCWILILAIMVYQYIKPEFPKITKPHASELVRFGSWATISGLTVPFLTVIDRVFIATILGSASVAVSSIAFTLNMRMYLVPGALSSVLYPHFAKNGTGSSRLALEKGIRVLTGVQTPILVLLILFIHPFLDIWLGNAMSTKLSPLILILIIGVWINGPNYAPHNLLTASGHPDVFAKIYLFELVPFLVSLWYAIVYFGLIGAMCVITVRYVIDAVLAFLLTNSSKVFLISWVQTIPAMLVAYIGALNSNNILIYILCSVLSFVLALVAMFRVVPRDVRDYVLRIFKLSQVFQ